MKKSEASKNVARRKVLSRFQFSTFIFQLAALLLLVGLVSCDNFMHGSSDFKEKLEQDIEYAESTPYEIRMECDEGFGSITSISILSKKVTDQFNVEFKIASGVQFVCWKAYSKSSDGTYSELSSDYIDFISYNTESNDGVYKATVKFVKAAVGIVIKPYCQILPKVAAITPKSVDEYPAGFSQDTTVKITFNKAMDTSTFDSDFSCISIKKADGTDLRAGGYFDTPYFSSENTVLNIPIKKGKFILPLNSTDSADITLSFNFTNEKDSEGNVIASHENYTYRVNESVDTVPPKIESLRIAKTKEDAENGTNLITFEEFTNYASGSGACDGISNHHVKSVWIYVKATDEGSGISTFTVKEKNIRKKDATVISFPTLYQTQFQNESDDSDFESVFEYTFKCSEDGVVNLAFSVNDISDNNTDFDKTSDLIKDTNCPVCLLGFDTDIKISNSTTVTYDISLLQADSMSGFDASTMNTDFITDMDGNVYTKSLTPTDGNEYTEKITLVSAEYSYDNENFTYIAEENITSKYGTEEFGSTTVESNFVHVQFTADKTKDVYLRLTEKDSVGNIGTQVLFYNKAINIVACKKDTDKLTFTLDSAPTDTSDKNIGIDEFSKLCIPTVSLYVEYTDPDGNIQRTESLSDNLASVQSSTVEFKEIKIGENSYNISELPDGTYNFHCVVSTAFYLLFWITPLNASYCGEPFTFDTNSTTTIEAPQDSDLPANFSVTPDTPILNSGKRTVNVKLLFASSRNRNRNPNLTYLVHYYHAKTSKADAYDGYTTVPESSNSIEISLPSHYCSWNFEIVAVNKNGDKNTLTKAPVDLYYDNVPPTITSNSNALHSSSNIIVLETKIFKDEGDGLYTDADGMIPVRYLSSHTGATLGGSKIDWNSPEIMTTYYKSSDSYCEFPFEGPDVKCLYIQIMDKNGNTRENIYDAPEYAGKGTLTYSDSKFNLSCPNTLAKNVMKLTTQYFSDGKWKNTSNIPSFYGYIPMTLSNDSTSFSVEPTFTTTEEESFVRLLIHELQYACYYPIYIYPKKYTTSNFSSSLKGHTQGSQGPIIYTDQPVLAHTFYCSKNLGNSAEEWFSNGIETGIIQKSNTFTYTSDNLSGVPTGKYYTTVIHYADGTFEMTDVKQK